jgi:integrating conjugative element membrane protein (TIGR03745 family)
MGKAQSIQHLAQHAPARRGLLVAVAAFYHESLWAVLPTPVAPSTAPASGNWLQLIAGYIKDGAEIMALAIAVLGFIWISYLCVAKFNEARQNKAEWAEVGVLAIVGGVVLIFISYLLNESVGVF